MSPEHAAANLEDTRLMLLGLLLDEETSRNKDMLYPGKKLVVFSCEISGLFWVYKVHASAGGFRNPFSTSCWWQYQVMEEVYTSE